jgi:hypothetical protein
MASALPWRNGSSMLWCRTLEARRMMAPRQGWKSSFAAAVVLVLLAGAFVAGTAAVALLAKSMPALTQ